MLRRTNFGMLVDDLGTSSEDEKALAEIIKIAESVGMEIIENKTAISIKFCLEVMKRLVESGTTERMHLLNHIDNLEERIKQIESGQERKKKKLLKRLIAYLKRPKCKNGYYCADCIHSDAHWEGIKFRGFSCRINAR